MSIPGERRSPKANVVLNNVIVEFPSTVRLGRAELRTRIFTVSFAQLRVRGLLQLKARTCFQRNLKEISGLVLGGNMCGRVSEYGWKYRTRATGQVRVSQLAGEMARKLIYGWFA